MQDVETHLNPNSIGLEGGTPQYYNTLPENHSMNRAFAHNMAQLTTAYINVLRRCRLNLWVRQFKSSNLRESRQPSQLLAHSFKTRDIEAVGSLVTSILFLYWYINLNKNLNGISFSISERSRFCVVLLSEWNY